MSHKNLLARSCFVLAVASLLALPAAAQLLPQAAVELTLSGGEDLGHRGMLIGATETLAVEIEVRGQGTLFIGFSMSEAWNQIDVNRMVYWAVDVADETLRYELQVPKSLIGIGLTVQAVLVTDEGMFASEGASVLVVDPNHRDDAVDPRDFGFGDAPDGVARPARAETADAASDALGENGATDE